MAIYCNNHPLHYAAFNCPKCHANLCASCAIKKRMDYFYGRAKTVYLCPKCSVYLSELSFAHATDPFWQRLGAIFQYPLGFPFIGLMTILALIQAFFTQRTALDLVVHFTSFGLLLTYACLSLSASSNGRLTPPPLTMKGANGMLPLAIKHLALYLILGALAYYLFFQPLPFLDIEAPPAMNFIFILILLLILPSILMLMVARSFLVAILPHVFVLLAWRIRWPYLALVLFLAILLTAFALLGFLLWKTLPQPVSYFLITVLVGYGLVVSYHVIGYHLFQYHDSAGFTVDHEGDFSPLVTNGVGPTSGKTDALASSDTLLNRVNGLISDGHYDTAITEIQHASHGALGNPAIADRYYELLHLRKKTPDLIAFSPDYIKLMHKTRQRDKICAAYLYCSDIRPDFLDEDPSTIFLVGKALFERDYHLEALKLFDRLAQIHSASDLAPHAYFFMARIFNEHLQKPAQAKKIIAWLLKTYPFHENASFVQSYARQIKA